MSAIERTFKGAPIPPRIAWHRPPLYPKQETAIFDAPDHRGKPARYSFIEASAQPLDTLCQTPDGPLRFGDLAVGSPIFAGDGSVTTVAGIFPLGEREIYRLRFSDGTETRACGEHLWEVDHHRDGKRVMTTDQLRAYTPASRAQFLFPVCGPVAYPATPVPIDPWLLGVLIGDGSLCGNALSFSTADSEIVDRVSSALPAGYKVAPGGSYSYRIVAKVRGAGYERPSIRKKAGGFDVCVARAYVGRRTTEEEALALHAEALRARYGDDVPVVNLRRALRALGLLGLHHDQKFIPDCYLRNSVDVRLEILRGIMDTDGSAGRSGSAVIEQTSRRLAGNIVEIVRSLGGFARLAEQPARQEGWKPSYRVSIRMPSNADLFWLPRKRDRAHVRTARLVRKLVAIEPIGSAPVQCISVTHPSSLYLTDDFIVTHNTKAGKTHGAICWLAEQAFLNGKPGRNFWWVAPVNAQAKIAFRRLKLALPPWTYEANATELFIKLINGGTIWFKNAEKPDNLYGDDVYAAVVDEASRAREAAWHAIRSTLTATKGPLRCIGNVKGRKNWFFRLARQAEAGADDMHFSKLTAWDAVEGGVLDREEIEDARRLLPEAVFRELYLAEASEDEGNPFGYTHIAACTGPLSSEPVVAIGVDLAKSQDWTVVVGLDRHGRVCGFERWQGVPWGETTARLRDLIGHKPALVDSTGVGDPIVEALQRECTGVRGFTFTGQSKQRLMEGLALSIQSRSIAFPPGPIRLELEAFEYVYTRTGVRYGAPEGFHDDCVMALALAAQLWRETEGHYAPAAPIEVERASPWKDNAPSATRADLPAIEGLLL